MSPALSRYLKDFSVAPVPTAPVMPETAFADEQLFADLPEEIPPVDVDAERRHAFAEGHEAATRELAARHRIEMAAAATAHRAEMDALTSRYETETAERIAASLKVIAAELGRTVSVEAAAALAPVMTQALTEKAIGDLAVMVAASILDGAVGPIVVSGPRALFDTLSSHLVEHQALLRHVEASDVDLTVAIGESVLVTRMSAWADSLRKVLQ
jgi:hypothetical protein